MKTISLCGTWQCQGSTGEHGGIHTWPVTQPFTPTYPMQVPGTVQEAFEYLTGDVHVVTTSTSLASSRSNTGFARAISS